MKFFNKNKNPLVDKLFRPVHSCRHMLEITIQKSIHPTVQETLQYIRVQYIIHESETKLVIKSIYCAHFLHISILNPCTK